MDHDPLQMERGSTGASTKETYEYGAWYDPGEPKPKRTVRNFVVEFEDSGGKFTLDQWRRYQSWTRYLFQPLPLFRSLYQEIPLLCMVIALTIFAGLYHDLLQTKRDGWLVLVSTSYFLPYYYLGVPLSLLLVFKTNNCFNRWWEARQQFGNQQNSLRNAARLTCAWVYPQDPQLAVDIIRLISLLAPAAGAWLLHDLSFLQDHAHLFTKVEFKRIVESHQPPVALGAQISRLLCKAQALQQFEKIAIEEALCEFMNTLGSLNRLSTMPIYLSYSRNCLRMTIWFVFGLPFVLWASMSWMTLPAVVISTVLLATIENIGTQIEQPLLVLPVKELVNRTKRHVETTLDSVRCLDTHV